MQPIQSLAAGALRAVCAAGYLEVEGVSIVARTFHRAADGRSVPNIERVAAEIEKCEGFAVRIRPASKVQAPKTIYAATRAITNVSRAARSVSPIGGAAVSMGRTRSTT
jgi:hypothetical protein